MKVNDYVRTKKGEIGKIIGYVDEPTDYYFDCYVTTLKTNFTDTYITEYDNNIKSSPNIIDLIEVGDYVNGMEVTMIAGTRYDDNDLHCYCEHNINNELREVMIPAKNIRRIVTREMFESIEYKVKE